ncbi:MAG: putative sugar nucleotidyl transferase, partial [Planctomycetota bacterium]
MRSIILFEDSGFVNLLPLVYWRTVFELRCGRKTLLDHVAGNLGAAVSGLWTRDWLAAVTAERFQLPVNAPAQADTLLINGRGLLGGRIDFRPAPFVGTCGDHVAYIACDADLARRVTPQDLLDAERCEGLLASVEHGPAEVTMVSHLWDLVTHNAEQLTAEWSATDRGMEGRISSSAVLIEADSIHVGQRAVVEPTAVIDAQEGPVYIGEGARICPHAYVAGPAYIGPGSTVNPQAYIHGGTSIGPI